MSLATELQTVTTEELSAAYRAANLRRLRYGLLTALNTPCIARALRLQAIAHRRTINQLEEARHANRFETQ